MKDLGFRRKLMFENSDNDPNPSEEEILEKVIFLKIRDSECGVVGWRCQNEYFGLTTESLQTFDTLVDALRDYLESLERNDPPIA
jgi:hypothetical protein